MRSATVLAHGCFDLLHLGHIRHLKEARKMGARLVVSVTADRFVNKGAGRPVFSARERVEALSALRCVDDAFVSQGRNACKSIALVKPAIYVKGPDYADRNDDPELLEEIAAVEAMGGAFRVTAGRKWSSTELIRKLT